MLTWAPDPAPEFREGFLELLLSKLSHEGQAKDGRQGQGREGEDIPGRRENVSKAIKCDKNKRFLKSDYLG